ncbi:MAG: hypothetical protein ACTHX0_07185 [Brachybacterium sp.]
MERNRARAGIACLLLTSTFLLGGCTKFVKESCSGSDHTQECTASFGESDGKWSTEREANHWHSTVEISGTFTIESGSGTLTLLGEDTSETYELSPEEPVVIEDLTLPLKAPYSNDGENDPFFILRTETDSTITDFAADYTFTTS